jgi:hypothetical protein
MSNPWMNEDPQTFLARLPTRDKELQEKRHEAFEKGRLEDALKFAEARRLLYERANSFPLRDLDKMLVSNMAHEAATQVILYQMWKQFGSK